MGFVISNRGDMMHVLERTREALWVMIKEHGLMNEPVAIVDAKTLSVDEAIGQPERQDYPILKGKEVMIEATFKHCKGQAFTDQPGSYTASLSEIMHKKIRNNFENAVLVASMNAVSRYFELIDKTVHCRNEEPSICAKHLVSYVKKHYGSPKIAFIGMQPGMIEQLSQHYQMRVVDMDLDNIGKKINGVKIESVEHTNEILQWSDLILATGSTAVNNTIEDFITKKPVVFYGVTVSTIAYFNTLEHYCDQGH